MKTYFRQPCPICGRPLHVPIELLGSEASCSHRWGVFTAIGDETQEHDLKRFRCIDVRTESLCERNWFERSASDRADATRLDLTTSDEERIFPALRRNASRVDSTYRHCAGSAADGTLAVLTQLSEGTAQYRTVAAHPAV